MSKLVSLETDCKEFKRQLVCFFCLSSVYNLTTLGKLMDLTIELIVVLLAWVVQTHYKRAGLSVTNFVVEML